ncbi:MAG: hypothetical protein PG981_000696 [Wolbachia endosymbiont of Ctenocephalides orientis wCori]|nr:MAG: hypothetical protein PG981_000696 [Wolbachia endosymbiont of Ctenocephalides orientis wCori]
MTKEVVEELIKIVGKGNLLEAMFICLGSFHNPIQEGSIDTRCKSVPLYRFIKKETNDRLDYYFNLRYSLEGMLNIYAIVFDALNRDSKLSTEELIGEIHKTMNGNSNIHITESPFCNNTLQQEQLIDNQQKLKLLNNFINPKGKTLFETEQDFENSIVTNVRELLKKEDSSVLNEYDKKFTQNKCVIDHFYSIHEDIKLDKEVILVIVGSNHARLSEDNRLIVKEKLPMRENVSIFSYLTYLMSLLGEIQFSSENGFITYKFNSDFINQQEKGLIKYQYDEIYLYPKNQASTLDQLLKNQDSNKFEEIVTNHQNYYSALQEKNGYIPHISSKKNHTGYKNVACMLIVGAFALSAGFCVLIVFLWNKSYFSQ